MFSTKSSHERVCLRFAEKRQEKELFLGYVVEIVGIVMDFLQLEEVFFVDILVVEIGIVADVFNKIVPRKSLGRTNETLYENQDENENLLHKAPILFFIDTAEIRGPC